MNLSPPPYQSPDFSSIWRNWLNKVYEWIKRNQPNSGVVTGVADADPIEHGFASAPPWVIAQASVANEFVSITAIGASTFTVAIKKHDGTAGTSQTIYWQAGNPQQF